MIRDLALIMAVVTFGIDCTDIIASLEDALARWLHRPAGTVHIKKPFSCSLCSTWWCCLAYCAITGNLTLEAVALSALMAHLSKPAGLFLNWTRDALAALVGWLNGKIDNLWNKIQQ